MADKPSRRGSDQIALDGGPLGMLHFTWRDDRYKHAWQFGDREVLRSVEGDSPTGWPLSPPIQQIHQQEFPDGRQVVFGVGMAGRGHWSVSYTLVPDLKCWIIEYAFRSPIDAEILAATYELAGTWEPTPCPQITEGVDPGHILKLADTGPLTLEATAPATLQMTDARASISATPPASVKTTAQWSFRLRVQ